MILRDVCGASFTLNKSLLRHVRTVHQGMKRTNNETRKRDVTDNEARKEGLLAGLYSETFGEPVEPGTDNEKQGQKAGAPRMRQLGRM